MFSDQLTCAEILVRGLIMIVNSIKKSHYMLLINCVAIKQHFVTTTACRNDMPCFFILQIFSNSH